MAFGMAADVAVSRGDVLVRALAAMGAVGLGGVLVGSLAGIAASAPSPGQDARILNYLLLLEYLQEAFYKEALAADALDGESRRLAEIAGDHEQKHVGSLRAVLGSNARARPEFRFGDAVRSERKFAAAALTLEETTAAAYIGQAANLTEKRITTVARIVPVEARHAAWIRALVNRSPAPHAADPAQTPKQVERTLEGTGFVKRS
jgi:rubrerythrin